MEFAFKFLALVFIIVMALLSYAIIRDANTAYAKTGYFFPMPSECDK